MSKSWLVISVILLLLLVSSVGAFSGSGSGTSGDPFIITNASQLVEIHDAWYGANSYYKLGNDINFIGYNWDPINTATSPSFFQLNGDGHTISNFQIEGSYNNGANQVAGIIGKVTSGSYSFKSPAMFLNLAFRNASVHNSYSGATQPIGLLFGLDDTSGAGTLADGVFVYDSHIWTDSAADFYVGGLSGKEANTITNCAVYNTIIEPMSASTATGQLTGTVRTGGVVSYSWSNITQYALTAAYHYGTVSNSYWDDAFGTSGYGGTATTTANMKVQGTYSGWDFTNTWKMSSASGHFAGFPILKVMTDYADVTIPVANFTPNATQGTSPMTVSFTDTSTNTPTSWYWVFGDGNTSTTQSPVHTFYGDGHYNVNLTATNSAGSNTSATQLIHVGLVPEADFTKTHTIGAIPLTVQFTDTSLHTPTSWFWNYADGLTDNNTQQNPMHTYVTPGVYGVTLLATNFHGNNLSVIQNITVGYAPLANFTENATLGALPFSVHFTDTSTLFPTSWNWTFDDGAYSDLQNPDHMFMIAGDYHVFLNATNAYGSNISVEHTITAGLVPTSSFTKNVSSGNPPLNVAFTFTGTGATSWNWSFDDGTYSNLQNPTHTFTSSGAYHVYCDATNTYGTTRSWVQVIVVGLVPTSTFTHNKTGTNPQYVQFNSSATDSAWVEANLTAFPARAQHGAVALNTNKILVFGGYGAGYLRDVYSSINNGSTWTSLGNAGWTAREYFASAVDLVDNDVFVAGGYKPALENDVWRSQDQGVSWTRMTAGAGWSARYGLKIVVLPDSSLVMAGGYDTARKNDVWRSTDDGATWVQQTAAASWSARMHHTLTTMGDGSIILTGGQTLTAPMNDVWRSTDKGVTWVQKTAVAGWAARYGHTTVVMPDDVLIITGGTGSGSVLKNDTWYSKDYGTTWLQYPIAAPWTARSGAKAVGLSNGLVVMTGGNDGAYKQGVWNLIANGALTYSWAGTNYGYTQWTSTLKNPAVQTYYLNGLNQIVLTSTNIFGSYTSLPTDITITNMPGFTGTPLVGVEPVTVCFTDTSTGDPMAWLWTFGDLGAGNTSTLQNPCHVYAYGTFSPTLQTTSHVNTAGAIQKVNYVVVTQDYPRVTGYTAVPATGTASAPPNLPVAFTPVYTGGIPTTYSWYINGTHYTTFIPSHTFTTNGVYTVNCTLSNVMGSTFFNSTYTVNGIAPAIFAYTPLSPASGTLYAPPATVPVVVNTVAQTGTPPFTYLWQVSDGYSVTTNNISHSLAHGGTYFFNYTVTNAWGHAHLNLTYVVMTTPTQLVAATKWVNTDTGVTITSAWKSDAGKNYLGTNTTYVFDTVGTGTNPPLGYIEDVFNIETYIKDETTGNWNLDTTNRTFYANLYGNQFHTYYPFYTNGVGVTTGSGTYRIEGYMNFPRFTADQHVMVKLVARNLTNPATYPPVVLGVANLTVSQNPTILSNFGVAATSTGGWGMSLVFAAILVIVFMAVPFLITRTFNAYVEIFAAVLAVGLAYFVGLIELWMIVGMVIAAAIAIFFMGRGGGGGAAESSGGEIG